MLKDFTNKIEVRVLSERNISIINNLGVNYRASISEVEFKDELEPERKPPKVYDRRPGPLHDEILTNEYYKVTGKDPVYSSRTKNFTLLKRGESLVFFRNKQNLPYLYVEIKVYYDKKGELNDGLIAGVITCNVKLADHNRGDVLPLSALSYEK